LPVEHLQGIAGQRREAEIVFEELRTAEQPQSEHAQRAGE
jgi:hypothetical protein